MNLGAIGRQHGFTAERPAGQVVGHDRRARARRRDRRGLTADDPPASPTRLPGRRGGGRQGREPGAPRRLGPARAARLRRAGRARSRRPSARGRDELRELARAHDCDARDGARRRARAARPRRGVRGARRRRPWRCARAPSPRTPTRRASPGSRRPTCACAAPRRRPSACVDCWASFFSERALFYRARKGSLDDLRMAVVMQEMVRAGRRRRSCSRSTRSQRRRDQMVVEAVFGLGEPAVSGALTPDNYVMARDGRAQAAAHRHAALGAGRPRREVSALLGAEEGGARDALGRRARGAWPSSAGRSRSTTALRRTSSGRSPAASCTCCSRAR